MASLATLNGFIERFVLPLVTGGRVEVAGLLGPGLLRAWTDDRTLDGTLVARVTKAVHDRLAKLGPVGAVDRITPDAFGLAAVWHNLLAMTHPEARGRRGLRRRVRSWCAAMLDWVGPPRTREEAALRHGVVGRIGEVGRVDTHVTFWAGYADFVGVAPPRVLLAWPNVRRVREDRTRHALFELLRALEAPAPDDAESDLYGTVRAAFAMSPVTDLVLAERPSPLGFAWTPASVNAVADPVLRGASQRGVLARGAAAVRAVEQATLAAVRAGVPVAAARALVRFHLEMLLTDALAARGGASPLAQPLALDAYVTLGPPRVAAVVGVSPAQLAVILPVDPSRPVPKDPPSAPLLARAGLLEVRS